MLDRGTTHFYLMSSVMVSCGVNKLIKCTVAEFMQGLLEIVAVLFNNVQAHY